MIGRILIDTGPLVAILRHVDSRREQCQQQLHSIRGPAFTCWPVITEAAHLLRHTPGGTSRLLDLCNGKDIAILSLSASDIAGIGEVLNQYHDQNLDLADACLMHLANREFIRNIFTIDQRHFSIFRASDGRVLNIVP